MTDRTYLEAEELFKERRELLDLISDMDSCVKLMGEQTCDMVRISTGYRDGFECMVLPHDLAKAIENGKRLLEAKVQEIENKIASKFKE
jgi:hypothetical protein